MRSFCLYSALLFSFLFITACKKEEDTPITAKPKGIQIKSITAKKFRAVDSSFPAWYLDEGNDGSDPDIYITISDQGTYIYDESDKYKPNAASGVWQVFTPPSPLWVYDIDSDYFFTLWDYDEDSVDDIMGGMSSKLYDANDGARPTKTITCSNCDFEVTLELSYQY